MAQDSLADGSPSFSVPPAPEPPSGKRRVAALVALSILEVIRARDLPTEMLGPEDPAQTMPRRLGLTEAVELQIRRYRHEVRRRRRITDSEVGDLAGLVLRRPDAEEVFFQVGELLAGKDAPARSSRGIFPEKLRFRLARRQVMRRFQALFGQTLGGFAHGPFALEARGHLLLEMDPGGDACALMTGFAQVILGRYLPSGYAVVHTHCQGRKDEICRWVAREGKG